MSTQTSERPYRSHSRPACLQCKRRRSRCRLESRQDVCLMCRVHDTECTFPTRKPGKISASGRASSIQATHDAVSIAPPPPIQTWNTQIPTAACWTSSAQQITYGTSQKPPMPLDQAGGDESNTLVVGPAAINDSQVIADLADYLEPSAVNRTGIRLIRTMPGEPGPVIFTTTHKRPLGMPVHESPSASKCQVIEKILEPHLDHLIDLYFTRVSICMPLLDEISFKDQYRNAKERISPALLCCLYANTMSFWRFDRQLAPHRCPDTRYLWNVATEALYSELHLLPTISTIMAIMLNVGGRPSTAIIGNGVLLGSAVSLAHSLGLNRNPLDWDIPQPEKHLRMKIWWSLLIHDKWSSLAYGTPPHIRETQYDVPHPSLEHLNASEHQISASKIFIALYSLTLVLNAFLEQLYLVNKQHSMKHDQRQNLGLVFDEWVENLDVDVRRVIIRGSRLETSGAPNLLLAYLTLKLLLRRMELNFEKETANSDDPQALSHRLVQVRRAAEEIVLLVQDLDEGHLGDFWLPISAFAFTSTTAFLLRCALDAENNRDVTSTTGHEPAASGNGGGLWQSPSIRLAHDLIVALRRHQERFGWDIADICLAQYADVVENLVNPLPPRELHTDDGTGSSGVAHPFVPDASFIDALFPSIWNTLQGI